MGHAKNVTRLHFGTAGRLHLAIIREFAGTRLLEEPYTPGEVSTPVLEPIRVRVTVLPPAQMTDVHGNWLAGNQRIG